MANLLLISNSTNAGEAYLAYPMAEIKNFLIEKGVRSAVFVPYAAVTFSFDNYLTKVQERFAEIGIEVTSVHNYSDPVAAISDAQAVIVGGGNTFCLLKSMQDNNLLEVIARKVNEGTPYVGWSAGSVVASPTICTTNDMPIVEPKGFKALGFVDFQINPHYLDTHPEAHAGETRQQRIEEYIVANKNRTVVGLREGCMIRVGGDKIDLIGSRTMRIFRYGAEPYEIANSENISI